MDKKIEFIALHKLLSQIKDELIEDNILTEEDLRNQKESLDEYNQLDTKPVGIHLKTEKQKEAVQKLASVLSEGIKNKDVDEKYKLQVNNVNRSVNNQK